MSLEKERMKKMIELLPKDFIIDLEKDSEKTGKEGAEKTKEPAAKKKEDKDEKTPKTSDNSKKSK